MIAGDRARRTWFLVGLFLLCMCGLMLQVIETRVLSVISFYHLAFFAISMAMFGMTTGSLVVYFRQTLFPAERLLEHLVWICSAFAIAVVLSTLLLISTVVFVGGTSDLIMAVLLWTKLIVILAIPYIFAGMAISLALTRSPWSVPLVYGVDLLGAATGCLAVLVVLAWVDAISALFLIGAVAAAAAACFRAANNARGEPARPHLAIARNRFLASPGFLALGIAVAALANAAIQPYGLKLSIVKEMVEMPQSGTFLRWNSFSRISVAPSRLGLPQMWGPSPDVSLPTIEGRQMAIDGSAGTAVYQFDGNIAKLGFLKDDITGLAYYIRHQGRAAIIGVGGGRDIETAELFGFRDVTGVELNPIFVDLLKHGLSTYNRVATLPGVTLNVDEARSWFARSDQHFDLIQMSMIDTWAATGAGAFSLSENGLYTVEGWRTFFNHLTPTGVLTVSRWYSPSILNETGRMVSLAVATLIEEGVTNPRDHVFVAATGNLATLILSKAPLSAEDISTLTSTVDGLGFKVLIGAGGQTDSPALSEIVDARSTDALDGLAATYHLDMSPTYDDRPFFFNQLRLTDPSSWHLAMQSDGVARGNLLATITLWIIIALSSALVLVTILVPSLPSIRRVAPTFAFFGTSYFLLIGLGFMFVEIGLIQRVSIYLGHPVYGLAIGLFGLILSTGIGSLALSRHNLLSVTRLVGWSAILGLYLAILPSWFGVLVHHYASANLVVRSIVSLLAIVPSGFLMGFGFPTGMEIANSIDSRPTPWFWAVNGAAGVLAAGLAVTVSIQFGISATLWIGAAFYFMLGPVGVALFDLRKRGSTRDAVAQAD
jgi:hypothetical protein